MHQRTVFSTKKSWLVKCLCKLLYNSNNFILAYFTSDDLQYSLRILEDRWRPDSTRLPSWITITARSNYEAYHFYYHLPQCYNKVFYTVWFPIIFWCFFFIETVHEDALLLSFHTILSVHWSHKSTPSFLLKCFHVVLPLPSSAFPFGFPSVSSVFSGSFKCFLVFLAWLDGALGNLMSCLI